MSVHAIGSTKKNSTRKNRTKEEAFEAGVQELEELEKAVQTGLRAVGEVGPLVSGAYSPEALAVGRADVGWLEYVRANLDQALDCLHACLPGRTHDRSAGPVPYRDRRG